MKEVAAAIGVLVIGVPGLLALIAASAALRGWVLSILWGWFIVPAFGLPPLSVPLAIGVALVVGEMTRDSRWDVQTDEDKKWVAMAAPFFLPPIALAFGWCVKQFI